MRLGIVEMRGGVLLGEELFRCGEYTILMLVERVNRRRDRKELPQLIHSSTNRSG